MEPVVKNEVDDGIAEIEYVNYYIKKNKIVWTNNETKQLMNLYKSLIGEVGDRFPYQKDMWEEIASYFPDKTTQQCMTRLSTMLRKKKRHSRKLYLSEALSNTINLGSKDGVTNQFRITKGHNLEPDTDDIPHPSRNLQFWSDIESRKLIDLYNSLIKEVGIYKRFKQKKDMWAEISTHFPNKDAKQCETRLMRLRYRTNGGVVYLRTNNITDAHRNTIDSYINNNISTTLKISKVQTIGNNDTEMNECIVQKKGETNLEEKNEISTTQKQEETKANDAEMNECTIQKKNVTNLEEKKEKTIQETLLEITAKKEEAKERRHKERLEAIKQLQTVLEKIYNKLDK